MVLIIVNNRSIPTNRKKILWDPWLSSTKGISHEVLNHAWVVNSCQMLEWQVWGRMVKVALWSKVEIHGKTSMILFWHNRSCRQIEMSRCLVILQITWPNLIIMLHVSIRACKGKLGMMSMIEVILETNKLTAYFLSPSYSSGIGIRCEQFMILSHQIIVFKNTFWFL
jgi:hypothetical protein